MAITTAMATSFKVELMKALHDFTTTTGSVFKVALYTDSATLNASTTSYSSTNEVASGGGYTTGGNTLTNVTPTSTSTTAFTDFADSAWTSATFTARGCEIYNSTNGNRTVSTHDFGSNQSVVAGTFTLVFPTADSTSAILRIA